MGDPALVRRWVQTWRAAAPELAGIRRQEIAAADTQRAVHDLFGQSQFGFLPPAPTTSGLVEQQARFARLRK